MGVVWGSHHCTAVTLLSVAKRRHKFPLLIFPSTLRIFFLCFEALLSMFRFTFGGFEKQNEAATAWESTVSYTIIF